MLQNDKDVHRNFTSALNSRIFQNQPISMVSWKITLLKSDQCLVAVFTSLEGAKHSKPTPTSCYAVTWDSYSEKPSPSPLTLFVWACSKAVRRGVGSVLNCGLLWLLFFSFELFLPKLSMNSLQRLFVSVPSLL